MAKPEILNDLDKAKISYRYEVGVVPGPGRLIISPFTDLTEEMEKTLTEQRPIVVAFLSGNCYPCLEESFMIDDTEARCVVCNWIICVRCLGCLRIWKAQPDE